MLKNTPKRDTPHTQGRKGGIGHIPVDRVIQTHVSSNTDPATMDRVKLPGNLGEYLVGGRYLRVGRGMLGRGGGGGREVEGGLGHLKPRRRLIDQPREEGREAL